MNTPSAKLEIDRLRQELADKRDQMRFEKCRSAKLAFELDARFNRWTETGDSNDGMVYNAQFLLWRSSLATNADLRREAHAIREKIAEKAREE